MARTTSERRRAEEPAARTRRLLNALPWWGAVAIGGLVANVVSSALLGENSGGRALLAQSVRFFAVGAAMGYRQPRVGWRWGLGTVVLFPLLRIVPPVFFPGGGSSATGFLEATLFAVVLFPFDLVMAWPAVIGGASGAAVRFHREPGLRQAQGERSGAGVPAAVAGGGAGFVVAWLLGMEWLAAPAAVVGVSALVGYIWPSGAGRWGVVATASYLGMVTAYQLMLPDGEGSNLWPLAIGLHTVTVTPLAMAAAVLGALPNRERTPRSAATE